MVEILVTVGPEGSVAGAEALTGPQLLRQPAITAVKQWKYRPVLRDGKPVRAYTRATVDFFDRTGGTHDFPMPDMEEQMAAEARFSALENQMPRTPAQVLADLEQDAGGGDATRRFYALSGLAKAALKADSLDKAAAYAKDLLKGAEANHDDWNYGNAIHDGHMVLGMVALRAGNLGEARDHLLDAGRTPGSPQLNSFGPNMQLAKQLLERGETGAALQYFELCRSFWTMGAKQLDAWSRDVNAGKIPAFGANLIY